MAWRSDPEKRKHYNRAYGQSHRHTERLYRRARRVELRRQVLQLLGNVCKWCGIQDSRVLQIDHIHGGGRAERRQFADPSSYYRKILCDPAPYQLLCANCNWIKRLELLEDRQHRI